MVYLIKYKKKGDNKTVYNIGGSTEKELAQKILESYQKQWPENEYWIEEA